MASKLEYFDLASDSRACRRYKSLLWLLTIAAIVLLRDRLLGARKSTALIFCIASDQQLKDHLLAAEAPPWRLVVLSLAAVKAIFLTLSVQIVGELHLALSLDELLELALLLTQPAHVLRAPMVLQAALIGAWHVLEHE